MGYWEDRDAQKQAERDIIYRSYPNRDLYDRHGSDNQRAYAAEYDRLKRRQEERREEEELAARYEQQRIARRREEQQQYEEQEYQERQQQREEEEQELQPESAVSAESALALVGR